LAASLDLEFLDFPIQMLASSYSTIFQWKKVILLIESYFNPFVAQASL